MNERIKELADQADGVVINKMMTGAKQYTFLEQDLEKFAELVVRECIEAHADYYGVDIISGVLKEHFGIKK